MTNGGGPLHSPKQKSNQHLLGEEPVTIDHEERSATENVERSEERNSLPEAPEGTAQEEDASRGQESA